VSLAMTIKPFISGEVVMSQTSSVSPKDTQR
jgi:hypothetical protein